MCTFFLRVDIFADPFLSLLAYFFLVNSYFTDNFHNVTLLSPFPSSLLPWAIRRREEKERERERERKSWKRGRKNESRMTGNSKAWNKGNKTMHLLCKKNESFPWFSPVCFVFHWKSLRINIALQTTWKPRDGQEWTGSSWNEGK